LTAAQRAMATAMIYPEQEKGGKGKRSKTGKVCATRKRKRCLIVFRKLEVF